MLIYVAHYSFLLWLLVNPQNHGDKIRRDQMEETEPSIYGITACTSRCLQQSPQHQQYQELQLEPIEDMHFKNCFAECRNTSSSDEVSAKQRNLKINENFSLNLICRDDRSLTFRIDLERMPATTFEEGSATNLLSSTLSSSTLTPTTTEDKLTGTIFIIRIHVAKEAMEYKVYLSNENVFTIGDLQHNTTHNITVVAMHSNSEYSTIAKEQQYTTLHRGFKPDMVQNIQVQNFSVDEANEMRLKVNILWKPSVDMTCRYNLIYFADESTEYDLMPIELSNVRQLYTYNLDNLDFSSVYNVGIRAKNPNNIEKESELKWLTFQVPSCVEWFNYNFNICAPLEPHGLEVQQIYRGENEFSLNITWQRPQHSPDYYSVRVLDLSEFGNAFKANVSRELSTLYIPKISLNGIVFEVQLTAYTPGGITTTVLTSLLSTEQHPVASDTSHIIKLISAILSIIFCIAVLLLIIFSISHRRAEVKRNQERCNYFEDLEKKAPIDPKATLDLTALLSAPENSTNFHLRDEKKIFSVDPMIIDRSDVTLFEVLGEGAFGLVRRGIYRNGKDEQREVAVKMLKDRPTADDVRSFRREIDVMKSVKKHPNIIGIIGYCTKRYNDMMLLTEYCSFGSLLNFLRDEWKYLHELQTKLGNANNNNNSVWPITNLNRRSVDNQIYFATNTSICNNNFKIDDLDASLRRVPLCAGDQHDIAKQVAVGMEFLAKNKVVHRDLAARNVLVAPDRSIKIADFGLSRDIYQENHYKKTGNGKLPIKWLALESMTHGVYTTQSDVWSFGILLYEIVTLGGTPYPSITTDRLLFRLKAGDRMDKPNGCSQEFYNLMYSCWNVNPGERPNFTEIVKLIDNMMGGGETPAEQRVGHIVASALPAQKDVGTVSELASENHYLKPL